MKKITFLILSLSFFSLISNSQNLNISVNGSFKDTIYVCPGETIIMEVLCNSEINVDFNSGNIPINWTSTGGLFTNPCLLSVDGTPYFWMDNTASQPRNITTNSLMLDTSSNLCFDMAYAIQANPSPCEGPDLSDEGVHIRYSTDNGMSWTDIDYWPPDDPNCNGSGGYDDCMTDWVKYCVDIPPGAAGPNTFLQWHQKQVSSNAYDHWGLDNISLNSNCSNLIDSLLWSSGIENSQHPVFSVSNDTMFTVNIYSNGVLYRDTVFIEVVNNNSLTINNLNSPYFLNSPDDDLIGHPAGGLFEINNIFTNVLSPSTLGPGNYTVKYHFYLPQAQSFMPVFEDDFSIDKGWTITDTIWQRDTAAASSGCHGSQDPENDYSLSSDDYLLGTIIGGCYPALLDSTYWVVSPSIDCSNYYDCLIIFESHTGVESNAFDNIYIDAWNGQSWINIYTNTNSLNEQGWTHKSYDVSSMADNNSDFKVRFGIGTTDGSIQSKGWNIDNFIMGGKTIDTSSYNCSAHITDTFTVLNQTKITKIESAEEIKIYPNPAKSSFKIKSENKIESVKIYNSLGCLVREYDEKKQSYRINKGTGLYFVKIRTQQTTYLKKIIIK